MTALITLLVAIAPAIALVLLIRFRDRNHPEPLKWIFTAVGLGTIPVLIIWFFGDFFIPDVDYTDYGGAIFNAFFSAAIPEEILKFAMLFFLASRCKAFDEMFDGIVYAVCIGMGFAGLENIAYLFDAEEMWLVTGVSRALLSVPAHYFFAVLMGAFFARAWFEKENRELNYALALGLPILVHGIYDSFCFSFSINEGAAAAILVAFFIAFKFLRKQSKQLIAQSKLADKLASLE